tara:strand:- start:221 stop:712 length:492 start_codon:yes stop_codon:yes gene_type:complete
MAMNSENISCDIRNATYQDAEFILALRNQPEIVALGSSKKTVTLDEHEVWFKDALESDQHLIFIVTSVKAGDPIGYSRLVRSGEVGAVITIALSELWRGRSIGSAMIERTAQAGFDRWSSVDYILAYILDGNMRSVNSFKKIGFKSTTEFPMQGHQVLVLRRR